MKKICHMTSAHNRYDVRIFEKECKTLASNGFNVTLLVNDNKGEENISGIRIISTGLDIKSKIKRMIFSQKAFLKNALEIDAEIYHIHDPELLPVAAKLKKKDKRVIFDSHEYYYEQIKTKQNIPGLIRYFIAFLYMNFEAKVFKQLDAIIFPCTLNIGGNRKISEIKNIVYINNVPKLDEFYNQYNDNNDNSEFKVCHIGSLTYNRGIVQAIKAAHFAEVPLILAGKFNPNEFMTKVQSMSEYQIVEYRGYVDRQSVMHIYKESKIGISTLLNKGQYLITDNLPTKVYEYMSMGLPVIISNSSYAKLVLDEYKFGVAVSPDNVDEIANAISYIKDNREVARMMGEMGRRAIKERFNWSIEEQKLINLYKRL